MTAGMKTTSKRIEFLSGSERHMNPMRNVVKTARIESVPERPSIPSVAFVALIDTTKRITARI